MLPIYSNLYYDFYTQDLHDYMIDQNITWTTAIVAAKLYETPEAEAGEGGNN